MIFRLDRQGIAHVTHPGILTTLCGGEAPGEVVTHGAPCQQCLDTAGHLAVTPPIDPLACLKGSR